MLEIDKTPRRKPHSYTLLPSTIDRVKELATHYDTSASRIVEALITQYGPKLLEQAKRKKQA
jgi:hypothetical protein